MNKYLLIITLNMILLPGVFAETNDLVNAANQAYADENYAEAIENYQEVINAGYASAELYYNLGNAYFKANELAPAILNYERAKKLEPFNDRITHNLMFANEQQKDELEKLPIMFYVRWWHGLTQLLSLRGWAILSIVLAFITALGWSLFVASRKPFVRRNFFWTAVSASMVFILVLLITQRNYTHNKLEKDAIVFDAVVTGKSSPDADSKDLFVIHEGLKVHILNKINNWYEVRLEDGTVGWLPAESLEVI